MSAAHDFGDRLPSRHTVSTVESYSVDRMESMAVQRGDENSPPRRAMASPQPEDPFIEDDDDLRMEYALRTLVDANGGWVDHSDQRVGLNISEQRQLSQELHDAETGLWDAQQPGSLDGGNERYYRRRIRKIKKRIETLRRAIARYVFKSQVKTFTNELELHVLDTIVTWAMKYAPVSMLDAHRQADRVRENAMHEIESDSYDSDGSSATLIADDQHDGDLDLEVDQHPDVWARFSFSADWFESFLFEARIRCRTSSVDVIHPRLHGALSGFTDGNPEPLTNTKTGLLTAKEAKALAKAIWALRLWYLETHQREVPSFMSESRQTESIRIFKIFFSSFGKTADGRLEPTNSRRRAWERILDATDHTESFECERLNTWVVAVWQSVGPAWLDGRIWVREEDAKAQEYWMRIHIWPHPLADEWNVWPIMADLSPEDDYGNRWAAVDAERLNEELEEEYAWDR